MKHVLSLLTCLILTGSAVIQAQSITLPPSGANQYSAVEQHMGLVEVEIHYSSPDVTGPNGQDRKGEIWGQLVPYGMQNLGFGTAKESPWRAGANINTTFRVSHDVQIEGKTLPAGKYGLHMIVQEEGKPWTIIFSKNAAAWGSYFYDPADDALRVQVNPQKHAHTEWLTYGFDDRQQNGCTVYLAWESLKIPFKITVPNMHDYYIARFEKELQTRFTWQDNLAAAGYCLQNNTHLKKGLYWSEVAISQPFIGQRNFSTLSTKAGILKQLGREEESKKTMNEAIQSSGVTVGQIHQYGRQLIGAGDAQEALKVFQTNAKKFPDTWPVNVGLARGYSAVGDYKKALKHAKLAQNNVPEGDQVNAASLVSMIERLAKGEDIN